MNDTLIYNAISTLISLLFLCLLAFWGYRKVQLDWFRQEMFILRDELFIDARDGLIEFQHPAYGLLRQTMNGYIRFGHDLSLLHLIIRATFFRYQWPTEMTFASQWERATTQLPEETQKKLSDYRARMDLLVAQRLLFGSVGSLVAFAIVVGCPLVIVAIIRLIRATVSGVARPFSETIRSRLQDKLGPQISQIDDTALACGQ